MAIEIVDLASYKMVIFNSYVSLPEDTWFPHGSRYSLVKIS